LGLDNGVDVVRDASQREEGRAAKGGEENLPSIEEGAASEKKMLLGDNKVAEKRKILNATNPCGGHADSKRELVTLQKIREKTPHIPEAFALKEVDGHLRTESV